MRMPVNQEQGDQYAGQFEEWRSIARYPELVASVSRYAMLDSTVCRRSANTAGSVAGSCGRPGAALPWVDQGAPHAVAVDRPGG